MTSFPIRIGVIFGGPSPEHDVSVLTGLQAARALLDAKAPQVHCLYWTKQGEWFEVSPLLEATAFAEGVPTGAIPVQFAASSGGGFSTRRGRISAKYEPLDLAAVLNCCHGGPGEDGSLQGALDLAGIAYTGPTAIGAALGMDKLAFGALVAQAGLPSLARESLTGQGADPSFPGPYIVKPRFGGSSIGIEVVTDAVTAHAQVAHSIHLRRGAVVEPYRPDLFDLQVAIRSWPQLQTSAIERPIRSRAGAEILGYADKYVGGIGMSSAPRELPAKVDPTLAKHILESAIATGELVGVRGVARVDFLSDGRDYFVNEINTIPGSLARHLFVDPVLPFAELLCDLFTEAKQRPSAIFGSAGSDGLVLRDAQSISAKLA